MKAIVLSLLLSFGVVAQAASPEHTVTKAYIVALCSNALVVVFVFNDGTSAVVEADQMVETIVKALPDGAAQVLNVTPAIGCPQST